MGNETACNQSRGVCAFYSEKGCFMNRTDARKTLGKREPGHGDGCNVRFGMNETACTQSRGICTFYAEKGCFMTRIEVRKTMGNQENGHGDGCHVRFGMNEMACNQSHGVCMFYAGMGCFMNRTESRNGGLQRKDGCRERFDSDLTACNQSRNAINISMDATSSDATSSAFSARQANGGSRLSQILLIAFAATSFSRN